MKQCARFGCTRVACAVIGFLWAIKVIENQATSKVEELGPNWPKVTKIQVCGNYSAVFTHMMRSVATKSIKQLRYGKYRFKHDRFVLFSNDWSKMIPFRAVLFIWAVQSPNM